MQARLFGTKRWFVVVDRGEEVIASLVSFVEEKGIRGGFFTGIGAVRNLVLGFFDGEKREYAKRSFDEVMELGTLTGTIGCADGKPMVHAHAIVAGPELISFAGHLFRAESAVSVEIVLTAFDDEIPRVLDKDTGLRLIRLPDGGVRKSGE